MSMKGSTMTDDTTPAQTAAYQRLKEQFAKASHIFGITQILAKDSETAMPPGAAADRTEKMKLLGGIRHAYLTAPEVSQWLDEAEAASQSLSPADRTNLSLMRRDWAHAIALSPALIRDVAVVAADGDRLHTRMRRTGDWDAVKDWYTHSFDVMRQVARAKQEKLGFSCPYQALVDTFSPGLSLEKIDAEFAMLAKFLPDLIVQAMEKQKQEPAALALPEIPADKQQELYRRVLNALGLDPSRYRFYIIDGHPSCSDDPPDDVRFTGSSKNESWLITIFDLMHEGGHGLYTQNQPKAWRYQPAGFHMGMAVHESQSMIMELQACRTPEFFQFLEKQAREVLNSPTDEAFSADNLRRVLNTVKPSFVRVNADELTYPAHIVLRYRLEKAIVNGELEVADLPRAWNEGMKQLLGIEPPDASKGCMQDVHWPTGSIGYFPAYTLGAMGAAQFFDAACKARPELCGELAKGNLSPLKEWLEENVHSKGCLLTSDELFTTATGEPLNAKYYLNHLSMCYLGKQ